MFGLLLSNSVKPAFPCSSTQSIFELLGQMVFIDEKGDHQNVEGLTDSSANEESVSAEKPLPAS